MTPMNKGLRAVGTVELGGLKIISPKRIQYIVNCAKELLPQLDTSRWMVGFRPTLPDFCRTDLQK